MNLKSHKNRGGGKGSNSAVQTTSIDSGPTRDLAQQIYECVETWPHTLSIRQ